MKKVNTQTLLLGLVILLTMVLCYTSAKAETYMDRAFKTAAATHKVEEKLLRAICWVESRHDGTAFAYQDGGKYHSIGTCQILYSTAKGWGLVDSNCEQDFRKISKQERTYKACKLFGIKTNINLAAKILRKLINKNNGNVYKAVSEYNVGTYRTCRDGWLKYKGKPFKECFVGGPVNIYYVLKVFNAYQERR